MQICKIPGSSNKIIVLIQRVENVLKMAFQ